ncbi:MAG: glycosyltransferase [Methanolinea sp.]
MIDEKYESHSNIPPVDLGIPRNQPSVSFLILTFNSEIYLKRCLDSVINQDYNEYEVIVIDGGSKDKTLEILQRFSKGYARVQYYTYPKTTIGKARDHGMRHVQGSFIVFLDSDCVLPNPDWLSNMISGFNSDKIAGVFTFGKYDAKDPSILRYSILSNPYRKSIIEPLIGSDNFIPIGTGHIIMRRDLIENAGGFKDLIAAEDIEITLTLANQDYLFRFMPGLEVHHYHVTSLSELVKKNVRNISGGLNSNAWKTHFLKRKNYSFASLVNLFLPCIPAIVMALKDRDLAWFWHPFIAWAKIITTIGLIVQRKISV